MPEQYLVTPQTSKQIDQETAEKAEEASQHELQREHLVGVLIPGWLSVFFYFIAGVALLAILNWSRIFEAAQSSVPQSTTTLLTSLQSQISIYTDNQIVSWITIVLFWGTVGLGIYTLFWLGSAFVTMARNEMVVETAFSNRGHFQERVRVPLMRLVLVGGLALLTAMTINWLGPLWVSLAGQGIIAVPTALTTGILQIVGAVVGVMVTFHVYRVLVGLLRHSEAIF